MLDATFSTEEIDQGKGYVLLPELFGSQKIAEARSQILQLAACGSASPIA